MGSVGVVREQERIIELNMIKMFYTCTYENVIMKPITNYN